MEFGTDIYCHQKIDPDDFGDITIILTFVSFVLITIGWIAILVSHSNNLDDFTFF